jgi:hypothetical protein
MRTKKITVAIQIHYISNKIKVLQRGSFPLSGKKHEVIAFEWWRKIKREMPFGAELEKVIADGEDITEVIMEMEKF